MIAPDRVLVEALIAPDRVLVEALIAQDRVLVETLIVYKIAPIGSGVDRLRVHVLVDIDS